MEYTNTGRRPKSYRTECRAAVLFSIIHPETETHLQRNFGLVEFISRPFLKLAMASF